MRTVVGSKEFTSLASIVPNTLSRGDQSGSKIVSDAPPSLSPKGGRLFGFQGVGAGRRRSSSALTFQNRVVFT